MQYASKVILRISLSTMSYNKADVGLMWTFLLSIGILDVNIFMIWIMNIYDNAI